MWRALIFIECLLYAPDASHICVTPCGILQITMNLVAQIPPFYSTIPLQSKPSS